MNECDVEEVEGKQQGACLQGRPSRRDARWKGGRVLETSNDQGGMIRRRGRS